MNFQSSCKIITNQSLWHYSHESQVLQKGPLLLSNCCARSLTGSGSRGGTGLRRIRPEEARRRRWDGRGAPGSSRASMGQLVLARGGSWWPGHVRRRPCPQHHRRQGTPATTMARKGAQEWWLKLEMAMMRLVGMEKACSSGNELGSGARRRRPWWLRSGAARARARA